MGSYLDAMERSFDFSGRTSRSGYWYFQLVMVVVIGAAVFADFKLSGALPTKGHYASITLIASLLHTIASISITVRRLHDVGRSGWWYLLCFVPFGAIVLLVWSCTASDGDNDYGDTPRGGRGATKRRQAAPVAYRGVRVGKPATGSGAPRLTSDGQQRFI